MKSFGVFLKRDVDENEVCLKCPHHKSVEQSLASEKDTVKEDLELQINLWNSEVRCTATNEKYRFRAIDFGIVCPLSTRKLVFLLPFKVDFDDFLDLVRCLSLDADLLCTVFNEDLKSTSDPAKSYHTIDGVNIRLLMYELSKENIEQFEYDNQADVTQITIKINSDFNTKVFSQYRLFLRFRIRLKSFDPFAKKRYVSNDWLQAAFSSTYMFDIRLNDVRELSKKKKELIEFNGFNLPSFSKVHFFYMADSEEIVENGSSMSMDKRLLENERWHSYLGNKIEFVSENIAHHWKCKREIKLGLEKVDANEPQKANLQIRPTYQNISNFTIFFKTEFSDCQRKRLLLYLTIVILLGTVASAIVAIFNCFIPASLAHGWSIWVGLTFFLVFILLFCLKNSTKA